MRKIYVVGASTGYARWMEGELTENMEEADLVVFTGGEDVDPSMYGEKRHPRTYSTPRRDAAEHLAYEKALSLGKAMIGICRGHQLLCVENGGRLIQHQDNPGTHMMKTVDNKELPITSIHHQAVYPWNLPEEDYIIMGWTEGMLHYHEDGNEQEMNPPVEIEMILFPKTNCFGIQGHPEMMEKDCLTVRYLRHFLTIFIESTKNENYNKESRRQENKGYHTI